MVTVVCPRLVFRRMLLALLVKPGQVALARVSRSLTAQGVSWLVRDFAVQPTLETESLLARESALRVMVCNGPPDTAQVAFSSKQFVGALLIGNGEQRGRVWGAVRDADDKEAEVTLRLVGAGMHQIPIIGLWESLGKSGPEGLIGVQKLDHQHSRDMELEVLQHHGRRLPLPRWNADEEPWTFEVDLNSQPLAHNSQRVARRPRSRLQHDLNSDRWSRTKGALGGEAVWQRLVALRVGIVGCGRSGSLLATGLASLGIKNLTLIDGDRLETHNLGEMDLVSDQDCGRPKIDSVVKNLTQRFAHLESIVPIVGSVSSPEGLKALKACDVLCCCVDNDAARLATAIVATLYHKILLDVGTGIRFEPAPSALSTSRSMSDSDPVRSGAVNGSSNRAGLPPSVRIIGADVRLIVAGDGCLLCRGNLSNYMQAVEDLCADRLVQVDSTDWSRRRAGSLRSLNQVATGLAVRLMEDLVAERITHSVWAHVNCDGAGRFTITYPPPLENPPFCALCAKAGLSDAGLNWGGV